MGYDKYGLNWSLWGDTAKEPEKSSFNPSDTVGKGWGDAQKQTLEEDYGDDQPDITPKQKAITCTLKNARFLPDEETDYYKPCRVTVDIESQERVTTQVTFSLFARYTDKYGDTYEYDQGIVKKVDPADDSKSATTELKLTTDVPDFDPATGEQLEYVFYVSLNGAIDVKSEVLKMPLKSEKQGVAVKLYEYVSVHDIAALSPTRDRVALVQDKWVYVFKKEESAAALVYECKPVVQGTEQTFEFAAPTDGDPGTDLKSLLLQPEEEYFILLSEIQLQPERVDYYTQHVDVLLKRATHLIANSLKAGTEPVNIYLTDFIGCTYYLRNEYDKCVQEHEEYISDKDRAQRIYLAGLVCEVARAKPRLKGWLDYGAVVKERDEHDKEVNRRLKEKEKVEKNLGEWKRSDGYLLTRDDYNGVKETEELVLGHEAALTSLDEINYLETEGADKKSWLNAIFEPEGRFIFFRKLETLSSLKNFWDLFGKYIVAKYLANFGPTKMKGVLSVEVQTQRIERFLDEVHEITEHANLTFPGLVKNKGRWFFVTIDHETKMPFIDYEFQESSQASGTTYLDTKNYRPVKRKWNALRKHIDKASPTLQKVLVAIEAVNLANSVYTLLKAETIKDKGFGFANFAGSAADFLASFEYIGGRQKVTKIYSQKGYSYKAAKLRAERSFAIINLTGAICDYIGALKGTAEASADGKNGIAAGWAVIGLASIASGTSAAMTVGVTSAQLAGAGVNAAFISAFGLSSTALGVIGIGLFVVGGGILWLFEDSEFHEWAKKCSWAKEQEKPDSVNRQIQTLHNLICEFTADSYLYENRMAGTEVITATGSVFHKLEYLFTLRVRPGYYAEEKSRYVINLKIIREGGLIGKDTAILDREIVLTGNNAQTVSNLTGDEVQTVLLQRFTGEELGLSGKFQNETFKYSLSGKLDFYGDGSQVLFDVRKEGNLKIRGRDL